MPEIKLRNITKRWGKFYAVDHLNLDIEDNSFITLLGPSGCGKTTTLRMIAGLETPTSGQIMIGDTVVFDSEAGINVPPNKRKVGFLFQNYALWPNMTVYDNIAFGVSNIKEEMPIYDEQAKKIHDMIKVLSKPSEFIKLIEESEDKKGKIDVKKVYLKLIDTYTISMFTAKELYQLKLQKEKDYERVASNKVQQLKQQWEKIVAAHKSKGEELNADYAVVKNGVVQVSVRKLTKEEIDLCVRRVSRIVKIGMFMDRYPAELSGGQQQRVAIARTLAPEPQVLFMDEPLSNLDAKLRLEMRYELQRLHLNTGSTFVYVTHDQMEAMTLATKICLINNGVLQQYDAPLDVYHKPNNLFVADFVGNPSINFVEAKGVQKEDGTVEVTIFDGVKAVFSSNTKMNLSEWFAKRDQDELEQEKDRKALLNDKKAVEKGNKDEVFQYHIGKVEENEYAVGSAVTDEIEEQCGITNEDFVIGIRPENVHLKEHGKMKGVIYGAMPTGMESTVKVAIGNYLLTGVVFGSAVYHIGDQQGIDIGGNDILLFDRKSGRFIAAGGLRVLQV